MLGKLPITREGVRFVPDIELSSNAGFAEIRIKAKETTVLSRGICGILPATAFLDGRIRPHEKTLVSRLKRQENIVLADGGALGKPILLTVPSLKNWWATVDQTHGIGSSCLTFCGQHNDYDLRVYTSTVMGEEGYRMVDSPLSLTMPGPLVIADGHHRAETHARLSARGVSNCDFIPVCIVGGDELRIGTFTREVTDDTSIEELLLRLSDFFIYELLDGKLQPSCEGQWLLVRNGACYRLTRKASRNNSLDVAWLDQIVLPRVFGITDTRADERITFSPTPEPKDNYLDFEAAPNTTYLCGFPLPMNSFFTEVSAGRCLPPKSTRFEPRVPSGLVVWQP